MPSLIFKELMIPLRTFSNQEDSKLETRSSNFKNTKKSIGRDLIFIDKKFRKKKKEVTLVREQEAEEYAT